MTGPLRGSEISKQQSAESLATKGCVRCTLGGQKEAVQDMTGSITRTMEEEREAEL